jgi:signal peptide peptidase SppA
MSGLLLHIADRVLNRPLMLHPDKLTLIASVLDGRIGIDSSSLAAKDADHVKKSGPTGSRFVGQFEPIDPKSPGAGRKPYRTTADGVAIIPVIGSLVNRGSWMDALSGVTSYEKLKFLVATAAADRDVTSILLDMDSPGGEAVGAFEAGDVVAAAARVKEVVAVVNGMAASAAYAIASQATRIVTTQSGISGSIGVVMLHADYSVAIANKGIKPTLIHAGARKVDGNPYQPLTKEVRGELQAEIDRFYDLFVSSVAIGRAGMTEDAIRATEARTYIGTDAVAVGLADAVGNFESILSELSASAQARLPAPATARSFTASDIAAARAAGRAEGLQLGVTDGGLSAAMARIETVLSLPEAQGRQQFALHLASQTSVPIDAVQGALKHVPTEADVLRADAGRAGRTQIGLVLETTGQRAPHRQEPT